ncbi:MAG: hypothetical protein IKF83_04425 [Clostridia bacterium]|nr:hypothetical protein [Clostridia bacterium]
MKNKKIILTVLAVFLVTLLYNTKSFGKYVIDSNIIVARLNIDRTKPVGMINYSTNEITNENVIVTVTLSEPIENVEGWQLSEDKLAMTKEYQQNITENVKIVDTSGNDNVIEIDIQNINTD